MTCAFSNLPKFLDNAANKDSKVTGKIGFDCCRPGPPKSTVSSSAAPYSG